MVYLLSPSSLLYQLKGFQGDNNGFSVINTRSNKCMNWLFSIVIMHKYIKVVLCTVKDMAWLKNDTGSSKGY